jgi:PTH1 family peptidyl-tRNA hydrolase
MVKAGAAMQLWVGLGNPGTQYAGHRHNIGFMALDRIAADHGFDRWQAKFKGLVAEGRFGPIRVVLLKPQTFMNLSGEAVRAAAAFWKIEPAAITVFHDELDLAPFRLRLKTGGGHAGHNGLRSIIQHLGDGFQRVRLGIGHPGHKDRVSGYVLSDFSQAEAEGLDNLLRGLSDGAPALAAGDAARFLNAVSLRTAPPRNSGARPAAPSAPPRAGAQAPPQTAAQPAAQPSAEAATLAPPAAPPPPAAAAPDDRSPMQRLLDRFR